MQGSNKDGRMSPEPPRMWKKMMGKNAPGAAKPNERTTSRPETTGTHEKGRELRLHARRPKSAEGSLGHALRWRLGGDGRGVRSDAGRLGGGKCRSEAGFPSTNAEGSRARWAAGWEGIRTIEGYRVAASFREGGKPEHGRSCSVCLAEKASVPRELRARRGYPTQQPINAN